MTEQIYLSHHGQYLRIYNLIVSWVMPALRRSYDPVWLETVKVEGWREFEDLLPEVPFIGAKNVWKFNLIESALYLGFIRAARRNKASLEGSVQLLYDIHEAFASRLPTWVRRMIGWWWTSPAKRKELRAGAARSQLREYSADWVFTYVEGDGRKSPYGVDIYECAILKFFRAQNEEELVSYLCKLDHFLGKALGFRFVRAGTLAEGSPCCDCRYILNQETTDWNPRVIKTGAEEFMDQAGLP